MRELGFLPTTGNSSSIGDPHCNSLTLRSIHSAWLGEQIKDAKKHSKELAPVLKEFKAFIENNPRVYMYFHSM